MGRVGIYQILIVGCLRRVIENDGCPAVWEFYVLVSLGLKLFLSISICRCPQNPVGILVVCCGILIDIYGRIWDDIVFRISVNWIASGRWEVGRSRDVRNRYDDLWEMEILLVPLQAIYWGVWLEGRRFCRCRFWWFNRKRSLWRNIFKVFASRSLCLSCSYLIISPNHLISLP